MAEVTCDESPLMFEPSPTEEVSEAKTGHMLSTRELIIFTYFWTVGGPFGIERCVN